MYQKSFWEIQKDFTATFFVKNAGAKNLLKYSLKKFDAEKLKDDSCHSFAMFFCYYYVSLALVRQRY